MKKILFILFPFCVNAQNMDSLIVVTNTGQTIRFTQPTIYVTADAGDSLIVRNTASKKRALLSPLSLPISTATQTALNLKLSTTTAAATYQPIGSYQSLITNGSITNAMLANSAVANLSGTNSGDNAANTTYANDYRAANFVAGTNYLAPSGNGSALTGITPTQIGLGNLNNTSDASKPVSTATQTALDLKANLTSANLVTPNIGAATGTSLGVTSTLGFATGAGGTVSQATNKGTAVTLNKSSGQITMVNSALAAAAEVSFTLTNSVIAANDVVFVSIKSGGTVGAYLVSVTATAAGSCSITLSNASAGSLSEAVVLNFVVIKGVNN